MTALSKRFQLSNQTKEDRFPRLFSLAQRTVTDPKSILSFGCSVGVECFALRKYFPRAEICGHDIDQQMIKAAISNRDRRKLDRIYFCSKLKVEKKFDLIFALMVFFSIESPLKRREFDKAVTALASHVKPNGFIVFRCLEHPFRAAEFEPIRTWTHKNTRNPGKKYYAGIWKRMD
jgi:trans-aconitate methyltransferase